MQVVIRIKIAATRVDNGPFCPLTYRKSRLLPALASSAFLHGALAVGMTVFAGACRSLFVYQDYKPSVAAAIIQLSPVRAEKLPPPIVPRTYLSRSSYCAECVRTKNVETVAPRQTVKQQLTPPVVTELPNFTLSSWTPVEEALPFPKFLPPGLFLPDPDTIWKQDAIWKTHSPAGSYDVVIVQPSVPVGKQGEAAILKGTVYLVYLDVGRPKMTALQFSVPSTPGPIVDLRDADGIAAPYPRVTVVPKAEQNPGDLILVHGFVTREGRLRDVSILGRRVFPQALLAMFEHWEFRPARRGEQPIEVEVVLAL